MISRRQFLRILGLTASAGAAGKLGAMMAGAGEAQASSAQPAAAAGRTLAMAVDLKKCMAEKGCTKCTQACHKEHNVPGIDHVRHEIKWIWKEPAEKAFHGQMHKFTQPGIAHGPAPVLCNHCDNPACVRVCPTGATWKREDGVVMMDWHRCIGCRYCMVACPYGARSFNWLDPRRHLDRIRKEFPTRSKGVVEKCNFCEERLAKDKAPVCVSVCPVKALTFGDQNDSRSPVRKLLTARFSLVRKPAAGTEPKVYYLL